MAFRVTPARAAARSWAMTAGQLALALAGVASCVALVCIIVGMLRWIIRVAKSLQIMDRPVDRPTVWGACRSGDR